MNLQKLIIKEGDRKEFDYLGYKCLILRMDYSGHLCGYIEIPDNHKLDGMDYTSIEEKYDWEVPAHGGLTFSGKLRDEEGQWIGFDCAHSGDVLPNSPIVHFEFETYKDMKYVESNLKKIVDFIEEEPNVQN